MPLERFHDARQWIPEKTTFYYTRTLTDDQGTAIGSANLATVTATFYETQTPAKAIMLDWDAKDVKNANGGTVNSAGKFELRLASTDTIILDPTRGYELRRLLLSWSHTNGRTWRHEVDLVIQNLFHVV